MIDLSQHKLELNYPCSWEYKLITYSHEEAIKSVKDVILERLKESKDGALANLASIMENIVSAKKRICYLYFLLFKF